MNKDIETVATGLCFTESPRWYNDSLWFSDFYSETVYRLDQNNRLHVELILPGRPSGLGWDIKGRLLVVNMLERALYRWNGESAEKIADLSRLAGGNCNDMIVSDSGHAYIGNFGSEVTSADFTPVPAALALVTAEGQIRTAADDMLFANGMAIIDQGNTLIVAESKAYCLTAFDIASDGSLSNRRVWAKTGNYEPDGICADRKGGIWVTTMAPCVLRLEEGGTVTHNIPFEQSTMACEIGGDSGQYLYVCTTAHMNPQQCLENRSAKIERLDLSSLS